ncbi:MAG TPA: thiolase family protein [Acetobacteraceae bacterium]|nr:thiolase family protein [Acetobacteraceae bacterium]
MSAGPIMMPIVILGAARTPIGGLLGALSSLPATKLGAVAIEGALARGGIAPDEISEVFMGNVLSAGLGQAPARQASLGAEIPESVPCTTINKMCGSGMQAMVLAHDALACGARGIIVAGGMESMSNAPFLLTRARTGMKFGHGRIFDHMALDGLEDAYEPGRPMGSFAEDTAETLGISREAQDEFAARSLRLAQEAAANGALADEIVEVSVAGREGTSILRADEQPARADAAKIPRLKPAFREGGTVTAANSSSISDGAAALLLAREDEAEARGAAPLARIVAHAAHAEKPAWFTTAPIGAIRKVLVKAGWSADEVDLFEINEAFAVVVLAAENALDLPREKINVRGGACALGHPIGASGARIVVTLLAELRRRNLRRGVAAICIGGGEALALAVERV